MAGLCLLCPLKLAYKQGRPLSPTLLGLYADCLHQILEAVPPRGGVCTCQGHLIPDLGYVDDFVLLATSAAAFHYQLSCSLCPLKAASPSGGTGGALLPQK